MLYSAVQRYEINNQNIYKATGAVSAYFIIKNAVPVHYKPWNQLSLFPYSKQKFSKLWSHLWCGYYMLSAC